MKSWERPEETHFSLISTFIELADIPPRRARILERELGRYMKVRLERQHWIPSNIAEFHTEWYREFYRVVGEEDPFAEIKAHSDEVAGDLLASLELSSFREKLLASIVANRLDFGVEGATRKELLEIGHFDELGELELLVDDVDELTARLGEGSVLLYLLDNHGEARFDLEVVRHLRSARPGLEVLVAAKDRPMLNDVTAAEAEEMGFGEVADEVVSTGTDAFGVPPAEVSPAFEEAVRRADVVVAKGQANLEFWLQYSVEGLFNGVFTKFPVRDEVLGEVPSGAYLCLGSGRYRSPSKPAYRDLLGREDAG